MMKRLSRMKDAASPFVEDGVARAKAALDGVRTPPAPVTAPWSVSIDGLLAGGGRRAASLHKATDGSLAKLGSLRISPESVGIDDVDAPWDQVVEVRTFHVADHIRGVAVEHEAAVLETLLPGLPGAPWLARHAAAWLTDLGMVAASAALEEGRATELAPFSIVYRTTAGNVEEVVAGVLASAILVCLPAVGASLVMTARERNIPIRSPERDGSAALHRAVELRGRVEALFSSLGERGDPHVEALPAAPAPREIESRLPAVHPGPISAGFMRDLGPESGMISAELVRTLAGHTSTVLSAEWSPSGEELATASADATTAVWGVGTGTRRLSLPHDNLGCDVSWSPDGSRAATGTSGGMVHMWNTDTGSMIWRTAGHTDEIRSVSYSPQGSKVATAANDAVVRVWNAVDGSPVALLSGHADLVRSVVWSPGGRFLATASHDLTVRVWDPDRGACLAALSDHTMWISAVTYSPDGRLLASASCDSTVRIWDVTTRGYASVLSAFDGWWVTDLAFSPDGRHLATIENNGLIRVWLVAEARQVQAITVKYTNSTVRWAPDGRHIATGGNLDGTTEIYRLTTDVP